MNCRQADKWIDQALDEALHPAQRSRLDAHLEACPRCRREWEVLRAADVALRAPRPVRAPEGMLSEFRQRLAQEEAQRELRLAPRRSAWPWFWPVASFTAAGAAAALVIGLNLAPGGSPFHTAPSRTEMMAKSGPGADPEVRPAPPAVAPDMQARLKPPSAGAEAAIPRPGGARGGAASMSVRERPENAAALPAPRAEKIESRPLKLRERIAVAAPAAPFAAGAPAAETMARLPKITGAVNLGLRAEGRAGRGRAEATPLEAEAIFPPENEGPRGPVALEADVQEVQSAVLPPEFNVSPAVLTALRREVEVRVETVPVREALKQITEAADVVVRVDDSVQPLRVTVEQEGAPLWVALQSVARQGRLEIVPEANQLLLRPAGKPAAKQELFADRDVAKKGAVDSPAASSKPVPAPAAPSTPQALVGNATPPDRKVWPATWGTLPERGFEPPRPEELPPSVAAVPMAMDEIRENNLRNYQRNGLLRNNAPSGGAQLKNKGGR